MAGVESERRREHRVATGELAGMVGQRQRMRVLDLSGAGARIASGEAMAPGRRYRLQVGGSSFGGRIVHCALVRLERGDEGGVPVFEAGIVFEPLGRRQQEELEALLGG